MIDILSERSMYMGEIKTDLLPGVLYEAKKRAEQKKREMQKAEHQAEHQTKNQVEHSQENRAE